MTLNFGYDDVCSILELKGKMYDLPLDFFSKILFSLKQGNVQSGLTSIVLKPVQQLFSLDPNFTHNKSHFILFPMVLAKLAFNSFHIIAI